MRKALLPILMLLLMSLLIAPFAGEAEIKEIRVISFTPKPTVTAKVTKTPKTTDESGANETPQVIAEPTETPEVTAKPTMTPEVTAEPTATPEVTAEPTVTPEPTTEPTPEPNDEEVLDDYEVTEEEETQRTPEPEEQAVTFDFDGIFLEEGKPAIITGTSYQSQNVSINLSSFFYEELHSDIHVADIYIRSLDCLKRLYGNDAYGTGKLTIKKAGASTDAILLINGDNADPKTYGLCIGNGQVYCARNNGKNDVGLLLKDGRFLCLKSDDAEAQGYYDEKLKDIWQSFFFGPSLLTAEGDAITEKKDFTTNKIFTKNPRSVFGYYEPGHYCLVLISGRHTDSLTKEYKKNQGATLAHTSQLMKQLGCKAAYNLDGGQTCAMYFNGKIINSLLNNGRGVADAIMIGEPGADDRINDAEAEN